MTAITRTNLATTATITLGERQVTKSLAEWIWRRREFAGIDFATWSKLGDRGLREGTMKNSQGTEVDVKIVRHYDPKLRDLRVAEFKGEPHEIDATLEVVNAVTDLLEG